MNTAPKIGDRVRIKHNAILGNTLGTITHIYTSRTEDLYGIELDQGGVSNLYGFQFEPHVVAEVMPLQLGYFDGQKNLAYIVIFLRNGGERLRAIWLAKNTLGIELSEARDWVDSVRLVNEPMPEMLPEIPPRTLEITKTASHWPPTVEARMKAKQPTT